MPGSAEGHVWWTICCPANNAVYLRCNIRLCPAAYPFGVRFHRRAQFPFWCYVNHVVFCVAVFSPHAESLALIVDGAEGHVWWTIYCPADNAIYLRCNIRLCPAAYPYGRSSSGVSVPCGCTIVGNGLIRSGKLKESLCALLRCYVNYDVFMRALFYRDERFLERD